MVEEAQDVARKHGRQFFGVGRDGAVLRSFGACAYAAALKLKVAQAAFSQRALWAECAPVRSVRALQVCVVASARACAGGCARSAFGPPRQRRRRRCGGEMARAVAEEVERMVEWGVVLVRGENVMVRWEVLARARSRRPLD